MEQAQTFIAQHSGTIYFTILSILLGIEIISSVPAILHTPLMSGANAIHGVVLLGALLLMLHIPEDDILSLMTGWLAIFLGTMNVAGGFFITGRMLRMFKSKKSAGKS